MACINAFAFCVSHADCRDEEFLVRELSTVREQLSKGLKYFTDSRNKSGGSDLHLKEQVHRFVKKLSTYLELSDEISYDLLVNFLATQNADGEDDVQMFIANGRISTLLNRLRLFYWQERLSLLSLLRLAVCTWHDSWSHIADVLFAMTPFNSRDELIDYVLNEYIRTANLTENFVKEGRFGTARLTLSTGVTDFESNEEFDSVIAQDLKEQLELLNTILVGVFQDSDLTNASSRFTKILETFWSKSFGLQTPVLYSMTKHRAVINQICFTQMLILIRAAHLDSPNLFGNSNEHDLKKDRPKSAGCTKTHFLNDSRLLNRLLASLSDLGDLPVHGPLLLFGAVCATAFGLSSLESADQPLESGDAYSVDPNADNRQSVARDARVERLAEGSETFSLVVERYAGLAIESLRVFNFLNNQLDGAAQYSGSRDQEQEMLSNDSSFKEDFNMSLIDFCANVAIFDLLTLLARDVVLWSLDSDQTNNLEDTGLFGLPNRTAFIQLFSKTLRIVVRHSSLAIRPQKTPGSSSLSKLSEGSLPSNGCIGRRITRLVQALTEGFPYDLSILRLCTSLMLPSLADTKQVQKRDSTMSSLVSELVTSMPYLAERLTPELSSLISCSATPWYPQLQADGDISASNQFTLSRVRTALSVDLSRDLGLNHDVLDASGRSVYATICSGVRLPTGTRGIIKSDMALVLWRQEYSVWSVVGYEISEAWKMIHNIKKSTDICQTPHRTHTPNWSTNPPGDELKVSSYLKLYGRLLRLQEFLRFGISCVEAGVHIVPSLTTAERTLGLITACIYQDIPEQVRTNASNFLHSQCPLAFNPNTSANSSDSSSDPLQEIVLEVLLPSVFQLLGAVMTNVSTSGSVEPFVKHLPLWNQVLSGVSRLSPHVTLVRNLQLSKSEFSLTSSLITDQLKPFTTGQGSSAFRSDCCSGRRFKLLLSYLNFASGLLSLTKWTYSFDVESFGGETATLTSISHTCFNLLKGTLLLVVRQLIGSGLYHNNPSSGLQSCLLGRPMDSYLALAEGCLILLTDLLTTRVSKQDVYSMYCNLEKSAWGQSGDDCLTDLNSSNLLSSLQYLALHLLMNTPSALSCLLTFSSVPLGTLLARFMISDHGFSLCAQMDSSNRPSVHNAGGKLARVVWFALTLVHHLLGFEHSVMAGKGSSPVYGPLLSGIRSRYDPLTGSHYVAILFSYLRYPYSVGVARSAIVVLKWLTQYSDLKLADCLGKNMNSVHSACLYRLASPTEDQLTRVELFDLLAETVLCRQPNTVAAGPSGVTQQPSDFLRFLLSSSSLLTTRGNSWLGTELTSELSEIPSRKRDCLECALVVLEEVQSSRKRGHLDQLSILLFWAVSKFIAAIYLQNLQTCINALNSKPKFWELFTGPIFSLLKLEDTKDELQSIVTELCGHIISVLSLELYALLSFQGPSKTNADLLNVIKRLVDEGGYSSWFALIHKNLQDLGCCDDDSVVQSQLLSVYEATCRWKCLLLIHLKLVAMSEADESKKTDLPLPWPDVDVIARHIINCLSLLKKIVDLPEAWALGDQLATCLTTVLTYKRQITKSISSPPKKKDEPLNHLQSCLEKLTGLLVDLQPVGNEQLHHTHADLLASCYLITRTIDQDCSLGADSFKELYLNLFECAFGYLSLLSSCSKLSATNENALCQSANLIMLVWSRIEHSLISERLFQTGILNNLLIILEQQSKEKKGAELCHCILSLLTRLICDFRNSSPVDADVQGVDLDKGSDQSATEHYSYTGAELIASYGELLSKVFSWPPVEILLQWVQEDETASSQCDSSPCLQLDSGTISQNTKYPWSGAVGGWSKLILVELHFLCTLHDLLGGLNHPFFGRLISIFCSDNAPHLELLSKLWCQPLYELRLTGSSLSPLPFTSVLLHNNILVPSRLKIAECIYALFWRLSLAGHSLNLDSVTTGSGLPTIGFNVLFHAGVSGETDGNMSQQPAFLPAYGPSLPSEFRAAVFRMTELQIHCCSVLLQRPGLRFAAKSSSVSYTTPVKTVGSNPRLHPSVSPRQVRSQTPLAKTGESPGPHSNAADAIGSADCSGEIELTIVARHLITCLSLLSVQIPLLGTLGLLTSEELRQLRSPVHLIFNTPTFDDLSPQLTFGILTTLAHSLGYLITKLTAHLKASHPTDASSESKKELRSLLSNAHEMTLSIIFSQATLILASDQPSVAEKQLLIRELSAELKSCNAFGRFSRRAHSLSHRSSVARSSRSPSSRSSSVTHHRHLNSSPQTPGPGSVLSTSFGPEPSGTKLTFSDSVTFGFEQAVERFAELIRLTG